MGGRGRWGSLEGPCEAFQAVDDPILGGSCRDREVLMSKLDRFQDDLALVVHIDQFEATVGVKSSANVETLLCAEIPGMSSGRL
jgi:hypothetical protein